MVEILKTLPFYHKSIAGKNFNEVLSIIRRWIVQEVGYSGGRTKDCLIVYDYFKIMDQVELQDLQEYQAIGFQISRLTDFCKEYDFPCLAFVQVNRDGITKETSDIISQSDRLLWLCHSCTLLKRKSQEELLLDGKQNGNMKLKTIECRFGPGMEMEDYINLETSNGTFQVKELGTKLESEKNKAKNENGFDTEDMNGLEF